MESNSTALPDDINAQKALLLERDAQVAELQQLGDEPGRHAVRGDGDTNAMSITGLDAHLTPVACSGRGHRALKAPSDRLDSDRLIPHTENHPSLVVTLLRFHVQQEV